MTANDDRADARYTAPLLLAAAGFVAAGGYVHLREWLDVYRDVPVSVVGSAVVRVGFPVAAAVSAVLAVVLVATASRLRRPAWRVVAGAALFQAGSLAALVVSRTGSLFGWAEPVWTRGADQSRAVEIGALVTLAGVAAITAVQRRRAGTAALRTTDAPSAAH